MTLSLPIRPWKLAILVFFLLAVVFFAFVAWQFDQAARQSERHNYFYTIELSYNTTIDNVTFILPVPELNNTPFFTESLLNRTAYGVFPDGDLSLVNGNGSPMLVIRAARMVPVYQGLPIAIEPGAGALPTTRIPGHEYTSDTPVLMPVTLAVMETGASVIDTRTPVGHEPTFFPGGNFTPVSPDTLPGDATTYDHQVPVFVSYTSEQPAGVSVRVTVEGSNSIWRGGWQSNTYSDSVFVEIDGSTKGWIDGRGQLITAGKV
jgi:hypothetical protein